MIVNGPPGVPLIRLVRSPRDLLEDPSLRINAAYYITKAIVPPMQRCFSLLGADVMSWYSEMPRKYHKTVRSLGNEKHKKSTISQYFATAECVVCSEVTNSPVCQKCQGNPRKLAFVVNEKIRRHERSYDKIVKVKFSERKDRFRKLKYFFVLFSGVRIVLREDDCNGLHIVGLPGFVSS